MSRSMRILSVSGTSGGGSSSSSSSSSSWSLSIEIARATLTLGQLGRRSRRRAAFSCGGSRDVGRRGLVGARAGRRLHVSDGRRCLRAVPIQANQRRLISSDRAVGSSGAWSGDGSDR
jgi:hypothetical protein